MGRSGLTLLVAVLAGCGGGTTPGMDGSACDDSCVPGWWTVATGPCDVCQLEPSPRECDETDCESLDAHDFRDSGGHATMWTTHSPAARTFTVIAILPEDEWAIVQACELDAENSCSGVFTCDGDDTIEFFACQGPYTRPSPELTSALAAAYAVGPGEYTY